MIREPYHHNQTYPKTDPTYEDTDSEMPAIAKISGTQNWNASLPQKRLLNDTRPMRKISYPPQWDIARRKPLDAEKMIGRAAIACGVFLVACGVVSLAILGLIYAVKLIQFSLTITLK